jgi:hypothetical protein
MRTISANSSEKGYLFLITVLNNMLKSFSLICGLWEYLLYFYKAAN